MHANIANYRHALQPLFNIVQNGDEASLSIISASGGLLVKMLITLESHDIFW